MWCRGSFPHQTALWQLIVVLCVRRKELEKSRKLLSSVDNPPVFIKGWSQIIKVVGWCFLRDTWSESVFERDWLVLYLALNKAVVGLNRIDSVSKTFTGNHLRKTLFLARAALGIVHQGTLPVLCVCSSNSAGVSILEWINKGEGWPCLEREAKLVWREHSGWLFWGAFLWTEQFEYLPPLSALLMLS